MQSAVADAIYSLIFNNHNAANTQNRIFNENV